MSHPGRSDAALGKIHSVNFVETTTKIGLGAAVTAAVAVAGGNSSNFDSLKIGGEEEILTLWSFDIYG